MTDPAVRATPRSIYEEVMGEEFQRLHPQIQRRFGFSSRDGVASVGEGVMDKVWRGRFYTLPFLLLGTWRNIMFPASGEDVPFTIANYAYRDSFGRETVTWIRKFHFPGKLRRFDATMIHSRRRGRIVDYLGNRQHLAVDIHLRAREDGGLALRSGEQRFYEGPVAFRFPLFFSGIAEVCEWWDEEISRFRIRVHVANRVWGPLFGYHGTFDARWPEVGEDEVPEDVKPLREERRE